MSLETEPFLPYGKQSIDSSDIQAVTQALENQQITRGKKVTEFEESIANYCDAQYAVAFNNGTSALKAACHVAEVKPADTLITTPNTFVATLIAGMLKGASPLFVDIDTTSGNLDLSQLEKALAAFHSTRGRPIIMPVHFSGHPVDMKKLDKMLKNPNAVVIEDAAHALGSVYPDGKKVGCCAYSQMTMFSFHPVKTITTGEGGMITTNSYELYHKLRRYRDNGIEKDPNYFEEDLANTYPGYYEVVEMTGNSHFTDLQAALGLSQFNRMNAFIQKRRDLVKLYRALLEGLPDCKLFDPMYDSSSACHLFIIQIDFEAYDTTRQHVMSKLQEKGIGSQVHYIPLYRHPFFTKLKGDQSEKFPEMEKYYASALTLPLYYDLSEDNVRKVVNTLKDVLAEERQKKYRKGRHKK